VGRGPVPTLASDPGPPLAVAAGIEPGPLRRLSKDFVVYGLGEVIVKAFSIITVPIYTRVFSPDEYGVLSYVSTLFGLFAAFLILGGDSAYARFFFEAKNRDQQKVITSTWIAFLGAWSVVVCLLILPFGGWIAEASFGDRSTTILITTSLLTGPVWLVNRMCAQVLRNEFRSAAYTTLNVMSTLLIGFAVVAVVALHLGILGVLLGTLGAELVMLPVRLWTARSMFGRRFSAPLLRHLLAFGVPIVPTSLAYWVFLTSDRLILGKVSSLEQLGLYSIANSLVGLASIAISAFGQAWSPHSVKTYEDDRASAPAVYARVLTYALAGFGWLAVGLIAFGPELLEILTSPAYRDAAAAIAPLAIAMVAMASTQVTAGGISLMKKTKYLAIYAWLAAGINVVLNLVLDGPFGMIGAAWATTAAYVLLTLAYLVTSQRLWPIALENRRSGTLIALIVLFSLGAMALPSGLNPLVVIEKAAFCLAFVAAAFLGRALDSREILVARTVLARIRR
jgi:O-antigen/teichoic acid export membrane protein